MNEIWKDIPGYEGLYQASTYGKIRSLDKRVRSGNDGTRLVVGKNKILRPDSKGRYLIVDLVNVNQINETKLVHRLIARTFIGDCYGLVVNHLNGQKTDNKVINLEITTQSENNKHSYRVLKNTHPSVGKIGSDHARSIPVLQIDLKSGEIIKEYESGRLAENDGFISSSISLCCNGKQKYHKGYKWEFK